MSSTTDTEISVTLGEWYDEITVYLAIYCLESASQHSGKAQNSNNNDAANPPAPLDITTPVSDPSNNLEGSASSPSAQGHNHPAMVGSNPTPSVANPIALNYPNSPLSPNTPVQAYNQGLGPPQGFDYPPTQQPPAQNVTTTNVIVVGMGPDTQVSVTTNFNLTNYLRNPTQYISTEDYEDAYYGAADQILEVTESKDFLDTITCSFMSKLFKGYKTNIAKNIVRLIYFTIQLLYPIIVAAVDGGNVTYNVVCGIFALIGFLYDISHVIWEIRSIRRQKKASKKKALEPDKKEASRNEEACDEPVDPQTVPAVTDDVATPDDPNVVTTPTSQPSDGENVQRTSVDGGNGQTIEDKDTTEQEEAKKKTTSQKILLSFAKDMAEEILIYPSLICNLYGFINERGWEFNDALAVFDFLLTMISFFLDALLTKINHIWLLYQLIRSTIKCQEKAGLYLYATPVNLMVPFSIGLGIAHTLMLGLIGIRIYADNFNTKGEDEEPEEGDYKVTSYTSFMIFCGAYLPLMSAASYIILNKHWFLQISWILYHKENALEQMNYLHITSMPTQVKLFGFMRDKHAYIAVIAFAPLFIAFYTGGFLSDYNSNDLPKGAESVANVLCTLFVIVFSIINIQAGIIFSIIIIILMIIFCIICTGGGTSEVRKRVRR